MSHTQVTKTHINSLPYDVLKLIFDVLYDIRPRSLLQASRVCYIWQHLAQHRFFHALTIHQYLYRRYYRNDSQENRVDILADTLRKSYNEWSMVWERSTRTWWKLPPRQRRGKQPPLSFLVRSLTFSSLDRECQPYASALTKASLRTIRITQYLRHLEIEDFVPFDYEQLKKVIVDIWHLRSLVLTSGPKMKGALKPVFASAWELASFATQINTSLEVLSYDDLTDNKNALEQEEPSIDSRLDKTPLHRLNGERIQLRKLDLTAAVPLIITDVIALASLSLPYLTSFEATLYLPGAIDDDLNALTALIISFPPTLSQLRLFDLPILKVTGKGKGKESNAWKMLRLPYSDAAQSAFSDALYYSLPYLTSVALSARFLSPLQLAAFPLIDTSAGLAKVFYYELESRHIDVLATELSKERTLPHLKKLRLSTAEEVMSDWILRRTSISQICMRRGIDLAVGKWGGVFYQTYREHCWKYKDS